MKAVLVGTDLMYRKDGSLAPIEINTNVGWDEANRVEKEEDVWNLEDLVNFIISKAITEVDFLPGTATRIMSKLQELVGPDVQVKIVDDSQEIADSDTNLIIRTGYNDEALVDSFCRDKIDFLKSLQGTPLACEFLLKTAEGFEGEITSVETEYPEDVPNFILKYRYPNYDKSEFPKLYRFHSMKELLSFAEGMSEDFFLMPYYYCKDKLWNNRRILLVREWSFFVANNEGGLDSIEIGRYTKVCDDLTEMSAEVLSNGEFSASCRSMFLSTDWYNKNLRSEVALLDKGDLVWMSDGSWKAIEDIQLGDKVKSLEIPEKEGYDSDNHTGNYGITVEELETETRYIGNTITAIHKLGRFDNIVTFTFTDDTDWYDTDYSSYPTVNAEGEVEFKTLKRIQKGDKVILINIKDIESPKFVVKEVKTISTTRRLLNSGYTVELDGSHLFISRTSSDQQAYAAIEHNEEQYIATGTTCTDVYACTSVPMKFNFNGSDTRGSFTDLIGGIVSCSRVSVVDKGDGKFTVYEPSVDNNTAGTQSYALLTSCQYQMSKNSLFLWTESGSLGGVSTFDLDSSTHKVIRVGYKDSTDAIIPYSYYPIPYPIQSGDNVLIPITRKLFEKQIVK